jgi:hypothetical protein
LAGHKGVRDVFDKDEAQHQVLVFGGVHIGAQFVGRCPEGLFDVFEHVIAILDSARRIAIFSAVSHFYKQCFPRLHSAISFYQRTLHEQNKSVVSNLLLFDEQHQIYLQIRIRFTFVNVCDRCPALAFTLHMSDNLYYQTYVFDLNMLFSRSSIDWITPLPKLRAKIRA